MAKTTYDPASTMRAARASYFEVNAFGADGGYADAWVDFKIGPIPFPFPNTRARVRALGYHDLHHILTGYETNATGEFEISAWELGAGCKDFFAAWQLNLGGLAAGLVSSPRRTVRAFFRGRASESLYGQPLDALLDRTVADVRARFVDQRSPRVTLADVLRLVALSIAGAASAVVFIAITLPLLPVGLGVLALRSMRRSRDAATSGA
jgi:hypothetical protein